jgi:PTS system nitrogen regulatory IIA component
MQIDVREAARLLGVTEKTIYRWIKKGDLPSSRVNDLYRFNRSELLEWATARRVGISPDLFDGGGDVAGALPGLEEALRTGGIHYRVPGASRNEVLAAVVSLMHVPAGVDRKHLLEVIVARESLGSTGLGGGIAIPHVRNPIVLHIERPMITLCFLETAVEFGAIDGRPVHTLFTVVSPTVKSHLHLLSHLTFGLRLPEFRTAVDKQAARDVILAGAKAVDAAARN